MTDLTPGPEMDRAVAEAIGRKAIVSGSTLAPDIETCWIDCEEWTPSRDILHAIEALEATRLFWNAGCVSDGEYYATVFDLECGDDGIPEVCREFCGDGVSIPEAACRAILAWAEAKEKNDGV